MLYTVYRPGPVSPGGTDFNSFTPAALWDLYLTPAYPGRSGRLPLESVVAGLLGFLGPSDPPVWAFGSTRGLSVTAAVMGLLPWRRYRTTC